MKKKRIITILILVAVVIILVYSFMPAPLQVEAAKVRKETIYSYVEQRSETSLPFVYKATSIRIVMILFFFIEFSINIF